MNVFDHEGRAGGVRAGVMKRQARGGGPVAIGASSARPGGTGDADDAGEIPGDRARGAGRARMPRLRRRLGTADLRAVPDARRELRALLRDWGKPGRSEIAELLTSELVTNALVHTDRDAVLTAVVGPRGLRVEVRDFVGRVPRMRTPEPDGDTHGRGLLLVQSLADSWGVRRHGVGKSVWFELGAEAA